MDIPGYQWDPERKRYFKILMTGELPTSDYTVSALAMKDRLSRRALQREEIEQSSADWIPERNSEVLRLGSRSSVWYTGSHIISTFNLTRRGVLVGSRDGTIALGQWNSGPGRSIVDTLLIRKQCAVLAVDNDVGSLLGYGSASTVLRGQFAAQMCSWGTRNDPSIAIAIEQGVAIWSPSGSATSVINAGSTSAVSSYTPHTVVAGGRDGSVRLVDMRTRSAKPTASLGNGHRVTHVAGLPRCHAVLATGLEDCMMLFDTRSTRKPLPGQFQGYENWSTGTHGLAVSPDQASVAVGTDTGAVEIFDIFSGNRVKTLYQRNTRSAPAVRPAAQPAVACIRWSEKALAISAGHQIRAFPSVARVHAPAPSQAELAVLAEMHSNINLHVKT